VERTPELKEPIVASRDDDEVALPAPLIERSRSYMAGARADRTRQAYSAAWGHFTTWCSAHGRRPLPAEPETVAAWITALADGEHGGGKPLSRATINQYLCAVVLAHHTAGHAFDRKHPLLAETWRGISRHKARTHPIRQAKALMGEDLRSILEGLQADASAIDARDAALLLLGWAAALRRSELIGLDWLELGNGTGFVQIEERGVVVTLPTSKGSQEAAVTIVVPCQDMRSACDALERWVATANLQRGDPVFRSVNKGGAIGADRLTSRSVSLIVKARVYILALHRGKSAEEARELADLFSGHSMRAGYATTAGEHDEPGYRIQQRMRHRSMDTTGGYIRAGQAWTKSGLKGFGF
jgi:integrase